MLVIKRLVKRELLAAGLLLSCSTANAQHITYINNHKALAYALSEYYGIPAKLILAVATLESASGKGEVACVLHNHFGIIGKNDYVNQKGQKSRYKQYDNVIASYIDFCNLLTHKPFYKRLKNNDNCVLWVKAMARAHYSETPKDWQHKVLGVLDYINHHTDQLDATGDLASLK